MQSLGTNLDQDLREQLGQAGEQAVNSMMRAGASESEANQSLHDHPETVALIEASQNIREGLENPQAYAEQQQAAHIEATTQAQVQQALANGNPITMNGETTVVGVEPPDTLPERASMTMGDAEFYLRRLQEENPTAYRLAEIALVGATGGPVKAATTTIAEEALNAVAGEQIAQGMETVTAHAGTLVTDYDDSVEEFRQDVRRDENGKPARIQAGNVFVIDRIMGLDLPGVRRTGDGQQNVVESDASPQSNATQPWKYENRADATQRMAVDVNAEHVVKGNQPPYQPGTQVIEYTTKQNDVFVRVHNIENPNRPWMMRKEAIEGLTAEQIQRKYSLPSRPSYVSEVHVPAGTRMRTGKVETNFEVQGGGGRGATQYEWLSGRVPEAAIKNTKELD